MQKLELVDDRFPALMRGEKISTIRWNEGDIHEGFLTYVASKNPALQAVVYVTRSRKMTLAEAARGCKSLFFRVFLLTYIKIRCAKNPEKQRFSPQACSIEDTP